MIIVFTGSHGCGKSSLIQKLRSWDNTVCVNSVTRCSTTSQERRIDGVENLDRSQYEILGKIIEATNDLIEDNKRHPENIYLVDRSVFDFVAYTEAFHKRGLVSDKCLQTAKETLQNVYKTYDLICYLPVEFAIVDDGIRSLDEVLRTDVDKLIWEQIKDKNNVITLSGSYEDRIESLRRWIDNRTTRND